METAPQESEQLSELVDIPEESGESTVEGTEQTYTPSYSYKVLDEERSFDPRFKDVIKSKEDEEYLRDLYTRADGLDAYKTKYGGVSSDFNLYKSSMKPVIDGFQKLKSYRDEKNYSELFNDLGLEEDEILQHALAIAKERELPEHQRSVIQQNREYQRELQEKASKLEYYERSQQDQLINGQIEELKGLTFSDDVADIRNALAKNGQDLATIVYNHGIGMYQTTGKEPTVKQAFDSVVNQYRAFLPKEIKQTEVAIQPTLPKVKPNGGINQATKALTLDDLKKMANAIPT